MSIRKRNEVFERKFLSKYAQLSEQTKGRNTLEQKCEIRTEYQRDRDRIIYSKAFRRLKHKTQVFLSPEGDHYRTRLTHTLEVSQIARTIARSLKLNEDLTEAIALGHDLGHTPFGHAGERVLNELAPDGFRHYEQSLRVVDILEKEKGLNLTWEVRDGILNHTGDSVASTLEGQIIKFADRIAYINHDIEDAIRGKVISDVELPKESIKILGSKSSKRINNMILNIVKNSKNGNIKMDEHCLYAMNQLRNFLFEKVYTGEKILEEEKAKKLITQMYIFLRDNIEFLNEDSKKMLNENPIDRVVCDYIAGMTDRYAIKKFNDIFVPASWKMK